MGICDRTTSEKLKILAECLPEIDCPPGCSLCCEIELMLEYPTRSRWDADIFIWHINGERDSTCQLFADGKCKLYEIRPFICRLFFKHEGGADCFRGLEPIGGRISDELFRRIVWCATQGTVNDAKAIRAGM